MRIRVLGASGTYPVPGRPASGFLLEAAGTRVWCDAGPGTFLALADLLDPDLVTAMVISHHHPDHCADFFAAYHAFTYRPRPRTGFPVYAPQATIDHLLAFVDAGPGDDVFDTFEFVPVGDGDRQAIGGLEATFALTDHPVPTVASRWTDGARVFAYSADTGAGGEWARLAHSANLFICEATYQGEPGRDDYPHHLTAREAGGIARRVGAERLVLTHIPPHLDPVDSVSEAEETFGRPVALAVPGAEHRV